MIIGNPTDWAPDGDEAFDDGSYVLQFDHDDRVRLIAFTNVERREEVVRTVAEVWINADEYYEILDEWQRKFETEWATAAKGLNGA